MKINAKIGTNLGTTLLQTAFIVLKLCGVISWSWWWVLSPLWITTGVCIIGILVYVVVLFFEAKQA